MSWGRADSRDCITPFSIFGAGDVPSDFRLPPELSGEFTGLFLPQDGGWFGLRRFPPRALILTGSSVWILSRQTSRYIRVPLDQLKILECGRILLLGWIGLQWEGRAETLPYNRHAATTVERFLDRLKALWLGQTPAQMQSEGRAYGAEVELKFGHAKSTELARAERVAAQFFHQAICQTKRRFGFRRQTTSPGDLVILSDRRVLWISERHVAGHEPYGTVSRSAPIGAVQAIRSCLTDGNASLECLLRSGTIWRVPLNQGEEDAAEAFAHDAARFTHGDTAPVPLDRWEDALHRCYHLTDTRL
jgi:hypothetical protein